MSNKPRPSPWHPRYYEKPATNFSKGFFYGGLGVFVCIMTYNLLKLISR